MKKILAVTAVMLCMLLFIPCLAAADPNCPLWVGTWEVKYADNSTRIWKIYDSTSDTGSSIILCKAFGVSETIAETDQKPFQIFYITFTGTYSYTESTVFSSSMPSREMDVNGTNDAFISEPGGQYPVESGKKTSNEVPLVTTTTSTVATTTTTTVATTTTTVSGKPCPVEKTLGAGDKNVERLRVFRDKTLAQSTIGRMAIQIYYDNADSIDAAFDRSPALRALARRVLEVIAPMAGGKD